MTQDSPHSKPVDQVTFSFGQNWETFIKSCYSPERLEISKRCLLEFLGLSDLKDRYFLDIGCGSGLSSLAAFDAGASRVVSFDIDPASVKTTASLRAMRGNPAHWEVLHGSVLDDQFVNSLDPADIAYSWGVLHHTGALWEAVTKAAQLMRPDGAFFIALYNRQHSSAYSLGLKRRYNRSGPWMKRLLEAGFITKRLLIPNLFTPWRSVAYIRDYKKSRGMSYYHDVRDWLGGYPFEVSSTEEVLSFAREKLGLEWVRLKTSFGDSCNEFLFARRESPWFAQPISSSGISHA